MPDCWDVLTGSSRRLQPSEFMDSRKELEAMMGDCDGYGKEWRQSRPGARGNVERVLNYDRRRLVTADVRLQGARLVLQDDRTLFDSTPFGYTSSRKESQGDVMGAGVMSRDV